MNSKKIRDILILEGKQKGLLLPQMQVLLAQERFLARLIRTKYASKFIWKGGSVLLRLYNSTKITRFTVDIDLLVDGLSIFDVKNIFTETCKINLEDNFNFSNIRSFPILRDTPYGGERFKIDWSFFNTGQSESLKIDVCTGDDVDINSKNFKELCFVDFKDDDLSLSVYPPHFIFAEKFETAYSFGTGNTRAKDYIDMWILIQNNLDIKLTRQSIKRCFARRHTNYKAKEWNSIITSYFLINFIDKQIQKHFKKLNLPSTKVIFDEIYKFILKINL
jgi:predicted nucleotidyltransferase component of viral defense system